MRGSVYYKNGDYDKSIADYTDAIRLDPKWAGAYHNRGLAYSKKDEKVKADEDSPRPETRLQGKVGLVLGGRPMLIHRKNRRERLRRSLVQGLVRFVGRFLRRLQVVGVVSRGVLLFLLIDGAGFFFAGPERGSFASIVTDSAWIICVGDAALDLMESPLAAPLKSDTSTLIVASSSTSPMTFRPCR